jgi:hypothetical protein
MDKYRKALFIIASNPPGFNGCDMVGIAQQAYLMSEEDFEVEWQGLFNDVIEEERKYHTALSAELENILK